MALAAVVARSPALVTRVFRPLRTAVLLPYFCVMQVGGME
jgi:hypothetical protein